MAKPAKPNPSKGSKRNLQEKKTGIPLKWVLPAAIAVFTFVVFSPSLKNGFTNWDDLDYVLENPLVVSDTVHVAEIFKTPVSLNYHPLTVLSLAWNYQTGGTEPKGFHFVNILFHLFNTVLVFSFIFLLTKESLLMAAIVSLFFGIHPMHVESVTWVSERKDVLYVFFFLSGLISYIQYGNTKKPVWYALTLALFILSCLSKGMALVFPFVLLLIDYYRNVKRERKLVIEKILFVIISIIVGVVAYRIQHAGGATTLEKFSVFERFTFASYGAIMYVIKMLVPYKLAILYPYPKIDTTHSLPAIFYLCPVILIGFAGLIYYFLRREKAIIFGLMFYLVTVAMVLQFIPVGFAVYADRYTYLSYVGLLFIVAFAFDYVWKERSYELRSLKYPFAFVLALGLLVFTFQTYARAQVWASSETLFNDEIEKYPEVDHPYWNRGLYYQGVGKYNEALRDYNKALEINPDYSEVYESRADLYFGNGNFDSALADYKKVIEYKPSKPGPYVNCAILYRDKKEFELAEKYFAKAESLGYKDALLYINRGIYYFEKNENEKAIADFTRFIELTPTNDANAYNLRGTCYAKLNKHAEAINDFSEAINLNPKSGQAFANRAFSENKLGKTEQANADIQRARELGFHSDAGYSPDPGIK